MESYEIIDIDQPTAVIGFKINVEERQKVVTELCDNLKYSINDILDKNCRELVECTNDKRSFFSWAYLFGAVPMSEEEIINTAGEISEEAVQNVINSFRNRCTDKIRSIENIILSIFTLASTPLDNKDFDKI